MAEPLLLKNRTSTVPPERTAERIEQALVRAGAESIHKRYVNSKIVGLDFIIPTDFGPIAFRLPVDSERAYCVLEKNRRTLSFAQRSRLKEQAERTAWKMLQDWVELQLSMVALDQVELVQVFMPHAVKGEMTFFAAMKDNNYQALLMPGREKRE